MPADLVVGDEPREGAAQAIRDLRAAGVQHTALLTGDGAGVAGSVAASLGLDEWHGDLLPEEKVAHLERIMAARGAAWRDGLRRGRHQRRARCLRARTWGLPWEWPGPMRRSKRRMSCLMTDSPMKIVEAIRRARRTRAIVLQNIVFALGVKGVFLALGAVGVATMWEAVIADMGVALAAILNATRAMR